MMYVYLKIVGEVRSDHKWSQEIHSNAKCQPTNSELSTC